jgi:hypothetical protein
MATAWEYLEHLSRHPHRGTATPHEAAAARDLAGWLSELGYRVEVQPFATARDVPFYFGIPLIMVGLLAAAAMSFQTPWLALPVALLLLVPILGEMFGWASNFDRLSPLGASHNLIARRPSGKPAARTIVVTAHYDTTFGTYMFHPAMQRWLPLFLNVAYGALGVLVVGILLRALLPNAAWPQQVVLGAVAVVALYALFFILCRLTGRHVNGANDNGSGTALAVALAARWARHPKQDTEVIFVLTGAEEVGMRGMRRYLKDCGLEKSSTYFVNLDNLGAGTLHYLTGEGMTAYYRYGKDLVALAETLAREHPDRVRSRRNLLLPTDALIPASRGYQAITFIAFGSDDLLPNYHWHTDTLDGVDRELLAFTEEFLWEYLKRLTAAGKQAKAANVTG